MSIFDGPVFLFFYLGVVVAAFVGSRLYQRAVLTETPHEGGMQETLDPYEAAQLMGGPGRVILAALASLSKSGKLTTSDERPPKFTYQPNGHFELHPVELAVKVKLSSGMAADLASLVKAADGPLEKIRESLLTKGLTCRPDQISRMRMVTSLIWLATLGVGGVRMMYGMSHHKPVGFLFLLLLISLVGMIVSLSKLPLKTARGEETVASLKASNAALEASARAHFDGLGATDAALAVAMFGGLVLMGTVLGPMAGLPIANSASGCGSSCGSSCGGGGGGGCGGGGCGGGGCGGCGG